jgi:adenylate cyclase
MAFAFASMTFYNYAAERRRVGHIRQVFGKHVSEEVMDQLVLERDGRVPMAEREVSVLFADIKDHSDWARHMRAEEFAKELNECLEAMAQAAFENGGTINVFTGDGVLVMYNAPIRQDDHALRAIKTGIAIQGNISKLNEKRAKQNKQPIAVRVGINTGRAMAGTLGSKDRLEYTVIGDTINMAKRTEGECEPGQVAITDDVVREVGGAVQVESIGMRSVKGRESGLMLYHVVGVKDEGER